MRIAWFLVFFGSILAFEAGFFPLGYSSHLSLDAQFLAGVVVACTGVALVWADTRNVA